MNKAFFKLIFDFVNFSFLCKKCLLEWFLQDFLYKPKNTPLEALNEGVRQKMECGKFCGWLRGLIFWIRLCLMCFDNFLRLNRWWNASGRFWFRHPKVVEVKPAQKCHSQPSLLTDLYFADFGAKKRVTIFGWRNQNLPKWNENQTKDENVSKHIRWSLIQKVRR